MRFSAASAQALLAARVDTHYVSLSPRQETHFRSKATCFDHSILKTAAEHILLSSVRAEISRAHLGSPFLFPKACTPVPLQLAGNYLCLSSHPFPNCFPSYSSCALFKGENSLPSYLQEARSVPCACDTPRKGFSSRGWHCEQPRGLTAGWG